MCDSSMKTPAGDSVVCVRPFRFLGGRGRKITENSETLCQKTNKHDFKRDKYVAYRKKQTNTDQFVTKESETKALSSRAIKLPII